MELSSGGAHGPGVATPGAERGGGGGGGASGDGSCVSPARPYQNSSCLPLIPSSHFCCTAMRLLIRSISPSFFFFRSKTLPRNLNPPPPPRAPRDAASSLPRLHVSLPATPPNLPRFHHQLPTNHSPLRAFAYSDTHLAKVGAAASSIFF